MSDKPTGDNRAEWKAYWEQQGEAWRTEPEIAETRQAELRERQLHNQDFPFKDMRLQRADIEWLLHTHTPVDLADAAQVDRKGLDLGGVQLGETEEYASIDLSGLPLAGADLSFAHLAGADLKDVHLESAYLAGAHLEYATELREAHLAGADLSFAHLAGAELREAHLEGAHLDDAHLAGADLQRVHLAGAHLKDADLAGAHLSFADLAGADLMRAHLEGADLTKAELASAHLMGAHLESANLSDAHLAGAHLVYAHLAGAVLWKAHLAGADLRGAFFDAATQLDGVLLGTQEKLNLFADVRWGGVNLAVIEPQIRQLKQLGDELNARKLDDALKKAPKEQRKERLKERLDSWRAATRANRQMAVALKDQGMNETADQFSYRARICQRHAYRLERKIGSYAGSWFLEMIAGYGFRPLRSFTAYLIIIFVFSVLFYITGSGHYNALDACVLSITAFHGRGFFGSQIKPSDPQGVIAACEAFIGLFIEIIFIATFTRRFFGD